MRLIFALLVVMLSSLLYPLPAVAQEKPAASYEALLRDYNALDKTGASLKADEMLRQKALLAAKLGLAAREERKMKDAERWFDIALGNATAISYSETRYFVLRELHHATTDTRRFLAPSNVAREEHIETKTGIREASSPYERENFVGKFSQFYGTVLSDLLAEQQMESAFRLVQQLKARNLLDQVAQVVGCTDTVPNSSPLVSVAVENQARTLRDECDRLNAVMIAESVRNEPGSKARYAQCAGKLKATEAAMQSLIQNNPTAKPFATSEPKSVADIAASLPADALLLDYYAYAAPKGGKQYVVFTLRRGTNGAKPEIRFHRLNTMPSANVVSFGKRPETGAATTEWQTAGKAWHDALLAVLSPDELAGINRLLVCRDDFLHKVPFAALQTVDGKLLQDRYEITYAPSASVYVVCRNREAKQTGSDRQPVTVGGRATVPLTINPANEALAVAAPAFGDAKRFFDRPISTPDRPLSTPDRPLSTPDRLVSTPNRNVFAALADADRAALLAPLPGTRREADAVKATYATQLLTDADAQEGAIKREMVRSRYLHFGTHGFMNDAAPMLSALILATPKRGDKEDGYLTAREVSALNLSQVELAVLSACNTASGAIKTGEGVTGLTSAFLSAGCASVVSAQWAVNDDATANLMTLFYNGLKNGKTKAAALRDAQRALAADPKTAHPYFWAAFILNGSPD